MFLRSIRLHSRFEKSVYPFNLPLWNGFDSLELSSPVTIFAGDNGTGKSTLLEALAVTCEVPTVGADEATTDASLCGAQALAPYLRLGWNTRTRRGFFLRAEDFFAFQKRINSLRTDLETQAARYEQELDDSPRDALLQTALGSIRGQIRELQQSYGLDADAFSHGEAFMNLFQKRLAPRSLVLLDEPEAPLSLLRQLALLSMMKKAVEDGCQLILATHSPLLMAFPGATIFDFNRIPLENVNWEDLESVQLWRSFLASPEAFVRRI